MEQSRESLGSAQHARGRAPVRAEDRSHRERALGVTVQIEAAGSASGGTGDVRIHYDVHPLGGISNVHVVVGPTASLDIVMHHQRALIAMRRYEGVCGSVRNLIERVHAYVRGGGQIAPGTRAFEARFEIEKLPTIIAALHADLNGRPLNDAARARIEAQVESLETQLHQHAAALDDLAAGMGYVAANDDGTGRPPTLGTTGAGAPGGGRGRVDAFMATLNEPLAQRFRDAGHAAALEHAPQVVDFLMRPGERNVAHFERLAEPPRSGSLPCRGAQAATVAADGVMNRASRVPIKTDHRG